MLVFFQLAVAPQRPFPKHQKPAKPQSYPQAEALCNYQASDIDEISLSAGENLSIIEEGLNFSANFHTFNHNTYIPLILFSGQAYYINSFESIFR